MSEPAAGHNGQLKSIVERIEHVEMEIKDLQDGRKEIYAEAKSSGWDVKIVRKVIAMRKRDPSDRAEEAALMETYLHALGMQP